ncbi:MlaD family protein [Hwangdonia lutea]|uniref:MlaD family protein n=1 Tax=Hwangdonia lutea TaxID=3075823 RepID=A0AA97HR67_9FLAO|nr:MlaD family protein [Hwangdonia sp. SCSIO 19198]WOD43498.1 MlaD family protein [Hwangdonia sp. SCSIO 19198]
MNISKEVKAAILVISGIILFIFGFNYLKGKNLLDSSRTFYAVYDNVEGLTASTPVTINGLIVGKVISIGFKGDGSGKLLVKLLVDNDFQFSKNSKAELYETGLIGGKAIAIVPAFDGAENAEKDSYLQGSVKAGLSELVNQKLTPLQGKIENMMVSADSLLNNLNQVFDAQTKTNLKKSIASLSSTIDSFKSTSLALNQVIKGNQVKIDSVLTNAEKLTGDLAKITHTISESDLKKTIKNLESTLQNFDKIIANLENGEGSMGKLLKDEGLYDNLEGATLQLEQLLEDMKLNPKRYVHFSLFGKKPKQYDAEGNEIKQKD